MNVEENVAQVNRMTAGTDVFVCTDKKYQAELSKFNNLVGVRFKEDNETWLDEVNLTKETQWWRLQHCWQMVMEYETEHGMRYDFYMKLRTDCHKRGGCAEALQTYDEVLKAHGRPSLDRMAFSNSDMMFGGTRPSFSRVATLFSRIGPDYFDKNRRFWPLDFKLVSRTTGFVNKVCWIVFPRAVVNTSKCCNVHQIKRYLPELISFVDGFLATGKKWDDTMDIVTEIPLAGTQFQSEQAFLLDLYRVGFEVHGVTVFRRR